jgi:hypothetical protein
MYIDTLRNPSFFSLLLEIDKDIINKNYGNPCPFCGGKLDRANYPRKPRGAPKGLDDAFSMRFSLCCRNDGCRKRVTPGSVRFFGRRVWLGSIILVACILQGDCAPKVYREFCRSLQLPAKTVTRWRSWWGRDFPRGKDWQVLRGRLARPIESGLLPASLLEIFEANHDKGIFALQSCLKLLTYQFN